MVLLIPGGEIAKNITDANQRFRGLSKMSVRALQNLPNVQDITEAFSAARNTLIKIMK